MSAKEFFDTCTVAYAFVAGDRHQAKALEILAGGGVISVQVLNELTNTCRRKFGFRWDETVGALESVKICCQNVVPLTVKTHEAGIRLAQRYGFRIYDATIIAAALESGCTTLYTEDLQHGQVIDSLTVVNPFV